MKSVKTNQIERRGGLGFPRPRCHLPPSLVFSMHHAAALMLVAGASVSHCCAQMALQFESVILQSPHPEPHPSGSFGAESVASVPDVNGDGKADVIVASWTESPGTSPIEAGRVYVFDGVTMELLRELEAPSEVSSGQFGYDVAGIGDLNGDGSGEIIVSGGSSLSRVFVFNGAAGSLLYSISTLGRSVSAVPDVNGDGRPDIIIGGNNTAAIYNGADGQRLRVLPRPPNANKFGWSVSGVPDVNGDGAGDVIVGDFWIGEAYIFDGATGARLHTLSGTGQFGRSVAGLGDVNGDDQGDVVVGNNDSRTVSIFDGATGQLLYSLSQPDVDLFGWVVNRLPDMDGDGRDDIVAGGFGLSAWGDAFVFSGGTGDLLARLPGHTDAGAGRSVAGLPDVNGDGKGELLIADPFSSFPSGAGPGGQVIAYLSFFDPDGDEMPNFFEIAHGLNPQVNDADLDLDGDGINNLAEYKNGTLPNSDDSDGDGLKDPVETGTGKYVSAQDTGTNPLEQDTDKDGVFDGAEVTQYKTDPNKADTDGDLLLDGWEVSQGTDPANPNSPASITLEDLGQPYRVWNAISHLPTFDNLDGGLDRADATFRVYVEFYEKKQSDIELLFETGATGVGLALTYEVGNKLVLRAAGAGLAVAETVISTNLTASGEIEVMWSYDVLNAGGTQTIELWLNQRPIASTAMTLGGDWSGPNGAAFGTGANAGDMVGGEAAVPFKSGTINLEKGLQFFAGTLPQIASIDDPRPPTPSALGWAPEGFRIHLSGKPGVTYELQVSDDLVNWTTLVKQAHETDESDFLDTDANKMPMRFYRTQLVQ